MNKRRTDICQCAYCERYRTAETRALHRRVERLEAALKEAQEWADRIAGDDRVCGWVHREDYGLYCLLAECPVDFDGALKEVQS